MDLQAFIVILAVAAALAFAGVGFVRRARSFTAKGNCEADCGCSAKTKNNVH